MPADAGRIDDSGKSTPGDGPGDEASTSLANAAEPGAADPAATDPDGLTVEPVQDIERTSIRRNLVHMLSSQVMTWGLGMVIAIVQPRFLGPATQGRMRLGFSIWTIAAVVIALGTSLYLNLELAKRGRAALHLVGPIVTLRVMTFAATSVVFAISMIVGGAEGEFVYIIVLFGVNILITTVSEVYAAVFVGLERMAAPAVVNVVTRFVGTVAAVTVLLAGGKAVSVLLVMIATSAFGLMMLVRALHRVVDVPLHVGRSYWRSIVRTSFAFMVAGGVLTLYQQVDTVVIALFVDEDALGWYSTADTLFGTLLFLPTILCSTIFPTLGRLYEHDRDALESLVRRTFAILTLVATPIGLGTLVVAEDIAPLLYGEEFRETGAVLAVLGVVLIITTVTILLGTLAMATGRQRFWNTVMLIGVLMTVPLDLVLVPWADRTYDNGAIGGALAYVATEAMMLVVGFWKIAPFLLDRRSLGRLVRILAAGGLMVAVAWPFRDGFVGLTVLVGAAVFVAATLALRVLSEEELGMMRSVLAKIGLSR